MPIVQPVANDSLFTIDLPANATDERKTLKGRIDGLVESVKAQRDDPAVAALIERLKSAAQEGFDGVDGAQPDWVEAKKKVDAIEAEVRAFTRPDPAPPATQPTRPGAYRPVLPDPDEPEDAGISWREIIFNVTGQLVPVPPEQLKLKADIEGALTTLEVVFPREKREVDEPALPKLMTQAQRRFREYQTRLLGVSQVGLQTPADPDTARQALESLQADILVREGPRVKNGYVIRLGKAAAVVAAVALIAYLIIRNNQGFSVLMAGYRNLLPLWVGTMIGAWLSFGIRRPKIVFKDLGGLEEDMLEPAVRLVFTGLIATAIFFIFVCQMVTVKVGGLSSADIMNHGSSAFLIGMLLGVSEQALPGTLTKRASQFVSELAGT